MRTAVQTLNPSPSENNSSFHITPSVGEITQLYISIWGEDDNDFENKITRQTAMIMDGVKAANPNINTSFAQGFMIAEAPDWNDEDHPCVGLKIHLALNPEDPIYIDKIRKIAELCAKDISPTTFKVVVMGHGKAIGEYNPDQAKKNVTIYPNYLDQKTNVAETIRLVDELKVIMYTDSNVDNSKQEIFSEHKCAPGIYLRAGAFTMKAYEMRYETVSKHAPFGDQIEGNLDSPETDASLFIQEIEEAIANKLL